MPKRTDSNQAAIIAAMRAAGADVASLANVGRGLPDLLVWASQYAVVEVKDGAKSASRRRLTPAQQRFHATWRGPIAIVTSVEEAVALAAEP